MDVPGIGRCCCHLGKKSHKQSRRAKGITGRSWKCHKKKRIFPQREKWGWGHIKLELFGERGRRRRVWFLSILEIEEGRRNVYRENWLLRPTPQFPNLEGGWDFRKFYSIPSWGGGRGAAAPFVRAGWFSEKKEIKCLKFLLSSSLSWFPLFEEGGDFDGQIKPWLRYRPQIPTSDQAHASTTKTNKLFKKGKNFFFPKNMRNIFKFSFQFADGKQ